jgi:hypothetical protein
MSRQRKKWALVVAAAASVTMAFNLPAGAGLNPAGVDAAENQPRGAEAPTTYIYAVSAPTPADAEKLAGAGYDLLENRVGDKLFVAGDVEVGNRLRAAGLRPEISQTLRPTWENPGGLIGRSDTANAVVADTFYGGYHTSMGHMNHLDQVAKAKPDLTRLYGIGKTFTGKYELKAMCITKIAAGDCEQNLNSKKPRFFLMTQTHAREIAAGEMGYRLIDQLTQSYGSDAEVTALLDSTEVWVLPAANPDGLDIVAQGGTPSMQRKNRNDTNGDCTGDAIGVDLNRNNDTNWGGASTSKDPCSDVFLGPSADSEPETQALHGLWQKLFKDSREGNNPAPADTTGFMLSIHTVAGMNLIPWQYADTPTPNDEPLKAIGAQMKSYNGYQTGQAPQILYAASGGHDDWIYDKLGVAAATVELGGDGECGGSNFHPPYSCVDTYWEANKPVLMYLTKIAKAPYAASLGPNVRKVGVNGDSVTATIDAHTYENTTVQRDGVGGDVTVAEASLDPNFGSATQMAVSVDGGTATATTTLAVAAKSTGKQLVYVRAKDKRGNYGPTTAAWLTAG